LLAYANSSYQRKLFNQTASLATGSQQHWQSKRCCTTEPYHSQKRWNAFSIIPNQGASHPNVLMYPLSILHMQQAVGKQTHGNLHAMSSSCWLLRFTLCSALCKVRTARALCVPSREEAHRRELEHVGSQCPCPFIVPVRELGVQCDAIQRLQRRSVQWITSHVQQQ
jgi:hypothetical protein